MKPVLLFVGLLILGAIWTVIWALILVRARHPLPQTQVERGTMALRRRLTYLASAIVLIVFGVSVYWFPYPLMRAEILGRPAITVNVTAEQWDWTLSRDKVPAGVPIEFDIGSKDVNHGFGVYDPQGHLIGQVQAMPGYTNRLILSFAEPGTYTVRCLEFCGTPHTLMSSQITVIR